MDAKIFKDCLVIIIAVIAVIGFMVAWITLLPFLYDYKLTKNELQVILLKRWPCRRLLLKDIVEIRKVVFTETVPWRSLDVLFAERWGNRLFKSTVLIRRKRGITKIWLITPKETDAFIIDMKSRLQTLNR